MEKTVPAAEAEHGVQVRVEARDILKAEGFADCRERLERMDREFRVFPVLFIGNNAYQGTGAVKRGLDDELAYYAEHGEVRPQVPPTMDGSVDAAAPPVRSDGVLPLLPVLLAGLADGINPCAFATVVFLLSLLALVGRTRREVLITGLVFAATVFATYFAIGFGLLSVRDGILIARVSSTCPRSPTSSRPTPRALPRSPRSSHTISRSSRRSWRLCSPSTSG